LVTERPELIQTAIV